MKKTKNHLKDIYERGNDYDQAELLTNSPCGAYVTIEMFNQVINKLISLINEKQEKLKLGYIEYKNEKYLHDVNDKDIFAEVANKAINDEYGDNIEQTYLKKKDQTYQYNEDGEIIGINDIPIAATTGSLPIKGEDGIYVRNDLTANIIGISADYAYASALSSKQDALSPDQMTDINSIPFKLDKAEFADLSANVLATQDYVQQEIAEIGTPLVIRGSKTCAEIEAITDPKVGDVYCVSDSGKIGDLDINANDEVAFTSDNGWIIIGREVAVDLNDYYKKSETSGADQISTALGQIDDKFDNYYTTTQTSGKDEISQALASKIDTSALDNYYLKTDTSSKDELNTALGNKANVSSLTAYVTNTDLATNYYDKTETSSKEEISGVLNNKADKSELDLYYTMAETSGSDELTSAFDEKLDKSFSSNFYPMYENPSGYLTEHQSLDGLMQYSGLGIVDGKITGYSGIPFAGQGGNPFTGDVQGALDEVYTNSGIWLTAHQDLSDYATLEDISSKVDMSALNNILDYYATNDTLTSDYYNKNEIDSLLSGKADYEFIQENYYNITETSAASEIADALDEKLDKSDFETSGEIWNETTNTVSTNSAQWSQGNSAVNELVESNSGLWNGVSSKLDTTAFSTVSGDFLTAHQDLSYISGKVDEKLDSTAFNPEDFYPSNNPSGFITGVDLSNFYTKSQTYSRDELYTRTEVDSLMDGKILVVTALPSTGKNSVIYYVGPNPDVSGFDKYDEFIWDKTNSKWIQVGEHSLDLSGYATQDDIAEVYDFISESLDDKLDTTAIQGINNTITAINGSAIKDTLYSAGPNIDITNNVISGKDWSNEITSAVSGKADSSDVEDLTEQMIENFSQLDENKLDISSFNDTLSGIEDEFEGIYETLPEKQDKSAMSGYVPTSSTYLNIGQNNILQAQAPGMFTQGINNTVGVFSLAQGQSNTASVQSFAQGLQSKAETCSLAQGINSNSTTNSLAQGNQVSAEGQSIAQGAANTAYKDSIAQGESNKSQNYAIAQGGGNYASTYSIAQGGSNSAIDYSQAFGYGNVISNTGMVIGKYNKTSSDASFVIGNGTNKNRSDLFIIKHDGTVSSIGDFVISGKSLSSVYDTVSSNSSTWDAKQDALTDEQLSAISSVSSIKGTVITGDSNIRATSAESGTNILWTLELTAQPVVTDTTLSGYSGIVATKDSSVSSQWNVGLTQDYVSAISSISSIPVITKQDIDDIWAIVTADRGQ